MKKILSILLIAACLGTLFFTGCAKKEAGETINGMAPVTLSFIFFDAKKSATDQVWNAIADEFKNDLNASFDIQFIAGSDYKDRMLVKFAAGDVWDMNFDGDWLQYFSTVAMNGYMDLTDLLPQYAPDVYKAYQTSGAVEAAKVNGRIMALPWGLVMTNRPFFQWRGDLLPDVNPSSINTLDDVEGVLRQLKAQYPTAYPIENSSREAFAIKNDFLEATHGFAFRANDPTIQVMHISETPYYLERAQYAERWQQQGYIWADVLVDQLDHNALINQGRLLSKFGTHEFATENRPWNQDQKDIGARWAYNVLYPNKKATLRTALANLMGIPRTSKNAERTLKFLNMMETNQKLYDMVMYGIQGTTYVLNSNGTVSYPAGMNGSNSNYMDWQGRWGLWKAQFMRGDDQYPAGFWDEEKNFALGNPNTIASPLDGFSFITESVNNQLAQMNAIYDAVERMLDVGLAGDPAAVITQLQADLNRAGLPAVKAEYQKQVNAFLAGKR